MSLFRIRQADENDVEAIRIAHRRSILDLAAKDYRIYFIAFDISILFFASGSASKFLTHHVFYRLIPFMEFEPKVYRTIIFVRHGQYSPNPEKLTALGRRQAKYAAKSIALLNPSKIHCSSMPRAVETATFISGATGIKFKPREIFQEGLLPGTVAFDRFIKKGKSLRQRKEHNAKTKVAKRNADLAFKELFKFPTRGQSTEVVVAHGNVIRHWVCKALAISEDKWLNLDVSHASLTTIRISKKGHFLLLGFAEKEHLSLKMRTYV